MNTLTEVKNLSPLLISKKEAAALLGGLSLRSIDYAIANKLLDTRRVGQRRMVVYRSLIEFSKRDHPNLKRPAEVSE